MTLQERLRALTKPCRKVDAGIAIQFDGWKIPSSHPGGLCDPSTPNHVSFGGWPHYTASLDAVVELVEREMPGVSWSVGDAGPHVPGYSAEIREDAPEDGDRWRTKAQYSDIPAVALLLALIEAKEET
jgi:hypothetical protein